VGSFALALGGFKEASVDAVVFQTFNRLSAVDNPSHDDDRAHAALGLAVGRGRLGMAEAGEEPILFLARKPFSKGLGSGVAQGGAAEFSQLPPQGEASGLGGLGPPGTSGKLSVFAAGVMIVPRSMPEATTSAFKLDDLCMVEKAVQDEVAADGLNQVALPEARRPYH